MTRIKEFLDWIGVNRSALVRGLVRQGSPRLRELRAGALAGGTLRARAQGVFVRWLESGWLRVQTGRAGMIRLSLRYLPISHSQIGSIAFGDLESPVQEAMVRHLAPGGVMYDIGANIGFFSLLGARLAGPEPGHVYAFEPAPVNAEAIRVNAAPAARSHAMPRAALPARAWASAGLTKSVRARNRVRGIRGCESSRERYSAPLPICSS